MPCSILWKTVRAVIWLSSEYTGVSHLKVVNEGAVQFYPEPVEYDTETHVNNIRMLATATDGDIYLGTRDGKVYVYDAALSRTEKERSVRQEHICPL